jgi:hypothetical protein
VKKSTRREGNKLVLYQVETDADNTREDGAIDRVLRGIAFALGAEKDKLNKIISIFFQNRKNGIDDFVYFGYVDGTLGFYVLLDRPEFFR